MKICKCTARVPWRRIVKNLLVKFISPRASKWLIYVCVHLRSGLSLVQFCKPPGRVLKIFFPSAYFINLSLSYTTDWYGVMSWIIREVPHSKKGLSSFNSNESCYYYSDCCWNYQRRKKSQKARTSFPYRKIPEAPAMFMLDRALHIW